MFEYKSEKVNILIPSKGIKIVKNIVDDVDTKILDELINSQAAEGWELVTHSSMVDPVTARINMIVTFRKEKQTAD